MNLDELKQWIGKTQTLTDQVTAVPLRALSATLDRADPDPRPGEAIPPCWHWLYFLPLHRQSEIGPDGHPLRGGFLPPVPLPQRMWASGRLELVRPLRVGDVIMRTSQVVDVSAKEGRTGPLVFVRVRHEINGPLGLAVIDEQDIVYREPARADESARSPLLAPESHDWTREIQPDDVLLFRYSALTFNAHRIHYDHRYAREIERHPGLVVHGPLIATVLLDLFRRHMPDAQVSTFKFRAGIVTKHDASPRTDGRPFGQIEQRPVERDPLTNP